MIQRAPAWMWITLAIVVGALTVTGIVLLSASDNGKAQAEAKPAEAAPAVAAPSQPAPITRQVNLLGATQWVSTGVSLDRLPAGLRYSFYGPTGTKVRFVDESGNVLAEGFITESFGVQGGIPEFAGPADSVATLRVIG